MRYARRQRGPRPCRLPCMSDGPSRAGAAGAAGPRLLALLDYDGTMTTHECNEIALQPFVGDEWWALEEESYNDRMSHAEVFDRQIGLIRAPRAELVRRLLEVAEPMPGLRDVLHRSAGPRRRVGHRQRRHPRGDRGVLGAGRAAAHRVVRQRAGRRGTRRAARRITSSSATRSATARAAGPRAARRRSCAGCAAPATSSSCSATGPATSARRARPTSSSRAATWPSAASRKGSSGARSPTSAPCSARSTSGWRDGEREAQRDQDGSREGRAGRRSREGRRPAEPRRRSSRPSAAPAARRLLLVAAAVAFQAVVWAFLIWLLRADGPWYHFFDVSDITVLPRATRRRSRRACASTRTSPFEYPPLALPLFTLPPHGDPASYPNWFAAEMIVLCSAAAALTGATAAALWRGLARPLAAAGGLRGRRAGRRRDHRQPLRRGGGAHARRLPASSLPGATPPPPAPRSASASHSSSRRACSCRWC